MNERYVRLYALPANLYAEGAPVIVSAGNLLGDNATGGLLAQLKIRNISPKAIRAAKVRIHAMDTIGTPLEGDAEKEYLDLNVRPGEEFGQQSAVWLPNLSTRTYLPELLWVAFEDNSVWRSEDRPWEPLPAPTPLQQTLGDPELVKQAQLRFGGHARVEPQEYKDLWRCSCGNWNREGRCFACGGLREQQLPFDLQGLISDRDQRLAQERAELERRQAAEAEAARARAEQAALKKSKTRKMVKKISLIALGVLLAAFLTYAAIWHIVPYVRYRVALSDRDAGAYDEAYAVFTALGDFSDSADQATETLYQKGGALMKAESYREAAGVYETIPDYKDSRDLAEACSTKADYLDAKALLDAGSYQQASEAFAALGSYSDSAELKTEADYLRAEELFENGQYGEAYEAFTALKNYKDSGDQAKESRYRLAAQLLQEKDYEAAYEHFSALRTYRDSGDQAKEAKYLFALQCYDAGDYEKAVEAFKLIPSYKDTATRLPDAKYRWAQALEKQKDWKRAAALYKELGDYEDSGDRYRESYYQYGLKCLSDKSYTEAVQAFKSLGDYQDSKDRLVEAKYGYVLKNKDRSNTTTYQYLQELVAANYKDAKEIYASLYAWHVTVVVNDSESDTTTNKSSISKYKTIYFHLKLSGGPPGGSVVIRYKSRWPDGDTRSSEFKYEWYNGSSGWCSFWYTNPAYGSTGTLRVTFYDYGTGEVIGEASVNVTS